MLTISQPLIPVQPHSYHKLGFISEIQNYYKQDDAVRACGRHAGLSDEVSLLEFSRLADGKNLSIQIQIVKHSAAMEHQNADGTTTKAVGHHAT
jgi:hypothetical protein